MHKLRDLGLQIKSKEKRVSEALEPFLQPSEVNDFEQVEKLLHERKYIVLQGPPGTGENQDSKGSG
jgi:hypothetical protein